MKLQLPQWFALLLCNAQLVGISVSPPLQLLKATQNRDLASAQKLLKAMDTLPQATRQLVEKELLNCQDSLGNTPLILAASKGDELMVKLLLEHGVKITKTNRAGMTSFFTAIKFGHINVAQLLLRHGSRALNKEQLQQQKQTEDRSLQTLFPGHALQTGQLCPHNELPDQDRSRLASILAQLQLSWPDAYVHSRYDLLETCQIQQNCPIPTTRMAMYERTMAKLVSHEQQRSQAIVRVIEEKMPHLPSDLAHLLLSFETAVSAPLAPKE